MQVLLAAFGVLLVAQAANAQEGFNIEFLYSPLKTFNVPGLSTVARSSFSRLGANPIFLNSPPRNDYNISLERHAWARPKQFSVFNFRMKQLTTELVNVFERQRDYKAMEDAFRSLGDVVNPLMLNYAFSVAISNRPDTQDISLPPLCRLFADNFVDTATLLKARLDAIDTDEEQQTVYEIPLDKTGVDSNKEHRVAYFREDVGIGVSHWKWHIRYPSLKAARANNAKDRRGELFYFFHHHLLARYDFERLSNGLARVVPLDNWKEPMEQGYFPKLIYLSSLIPVSSRQSGTRIRDVDRKGDHVKATIKDLETWRDRVCEAIVKGVAKTAQGGEISLKEGNGIDILGDMIESSDLSPDLAYYGNLHGQGHILIAFSHDPNGIHQEPSGAMFSPITAPRDPTFFRWHQYVENIFQKFKDTLSPYTIQELEYPNITVDHVELMTENQTVNTLNTFFRTGHVDITNGLDLDPTKTIISKFTHLDHKPFSYHITVKNSNDVPKVGTVRIFLAPKFNEKGRPFPLSEQRKLMVEMDRYTVSLKPGDNEIHRESIESSVTIPSKCNFHNIDIDDVAEWKKQELSKECGCGWPHYLLVPKGTEKGLQAVLFVMISDNKVDKANIGAESSSSRGSVVCGLERDKYPDARAMGYPFDRKIDNLSDFLTTNMAYTDVVIRFSNDTTFRS